MFELLWKAKICLYYYRNLSIYKLAACKTIDMHYQVCTKQSKKTLSGRLLGVFRDKQRKFEVHLLTLYISASHFISFLNFYLMIMYLGNTIYMGIPINCCCCCCCCCCCWHFKLPSLLINPSVVQDLKRKLILYYFPIQLWMFILFGTK